MGSWLDDYSDGIAGFFTGYAISYYAYLSIVLSEIFYIWRFLPENAMIFTILLIANCVVIGIFGALKRIFVFTKGERVVTRVYWIPLAIIFAIGCFVNFLQNLVLYFLPVIFTAIWVFLRDIQNMRFAESDSKILVIVTEFFSNCLMWPILLAFVSFTPLVILTYVTNLVFQSRLLTFFIPFAFAMVLPFITWFEENYVNENIFEIGYEIVYTKRVENLLKELNITSEVFWYEEFEQAVSRLQEKGETDEAWEEFGTELKRIQSVLDEMEEEN